jgi:prevent-host-death family protein
MRILPIHEAKNNFSALLQEVEQGEEIVITRHGKHIARIVREVPAQMSEQERAQRRKEAIARLEALHARIGPDPNYQPGDWKKYRDAGRKY